MLSLIYIVGNIFASLALLMTMIGAVSTRKVKLDIASGLSMLMSFVFIALCVGISIMHPYIFLACAMITAGYMLIMLQPGREDFLFAIIWVAICFFFWGEVIALAMFNTMFISEEDEIGA